jgi:hypothetical protein
MRRFEIFQGVFYLTVKEAKDFKVNEYKEKVLKIIKNL